MADLSSLLGGTGIGGAIGAAVVRLDLDTKKYQAELAAAHTQTTAGTQKMSTGFANLGKIAAIGLAGAGVAAVAFGAVAVKAAIEANEAHIKLQNTFDNNARLADSSVAAFENQADAIRRVTGVDDEAIISAQALLGQFKLTGQQVQQLTPLVVDLSEKMGVGLDAAARAVGKATQGSTGALARYGVQIEDTDTVAEAFTATVEGLGIAEGFAAERADAEPWRLLASQWEELEEQAGQGLLPILQKISDTFFGTQITIEEAARSGEVWILKHADAVQTQARAISDAQAKAAIYASTLPEVTLANEKGARAAERMAEEYKELEKASEESIRSQVDSLDGFEAKWHGTTESAIRAMEGMAKQAKQMARDFAALDQTAIPQGFRDFLLEQGPAAVHEFVNGTEREKARFIRAWKQYEGAVRDAVNNMKGIADTGGRSVGVAMMQGLTTAVREGSSQVAAEAAAAVTRAIAAARRAAQAESPSKKMRELGWDLIRGLQRGIEDEEDKLVNIANRLINRMVTEMEKQIADAQDRLSKVVSKAQGLRGAVAQGFSSFLDISGAFGLGAAEIGGFFGGQVAGAQQFADILKALKAQGLSLPLLQQIAQAGPEAIPFAQSLLQMGPEGIAGVNAQFAEIAEIAGTTGRVLSEKFFGDKIDELRDELKLLRKELRELQKEPKRVELIIRKGSDRAVEQLILQVVSGLELQGAVL